MQIFSSKKHLLIIKEPQICYLKNKTSIAKKGKDAHGSGTEKKNNSQILRQLNKCGTCLLNIMKIQRIWIKHERVKSSENQTTGGIFYPIETAKILNKTIILLYRIGIAQ